MLEGKTVTRTLLTIHHTFAIWMTDVFRRLNNRQSETTLKVHTDIDLIVMDSQFECYCL